MSAEFERRLGGRADKEEDDGRRPSFLALPVSTSALMTSPPFFGSAG